MAIFSPGDEQLASVIHETRLDGSPCGGEGVETQLPDFSPPPKRWFICRKCREQFWRRRDNS